jgi:hypothetical protein
MFEIQIQKNALAIMRWIYIAKPNPTSEALHVISIFWSTVAVHKTGTQICRPEYPSAFRNPSEALLGGLFDKNACRSTVPTQPCIRLEDETRAIRMAWGRVFVMYVALVEAWIACYRAFKHN